MREIGPTLTAAELRELREEVEADARLDALALLFHSLADSTSLRILVLLQRELCVRDLTAILDISVPVASVHLGQLAAVGLVAPRREGFTTLWSWAEESAAPDLIAMAYDES